MAARLLDWPEQFAAKKANDVNAPGGHHVGEFLHILLMSRQNETKNDCCPPGHVRFRILGQRRQYLVHRAIYQ
jgi:hypothetical protein